MYHYLGSLIIFFLPLAFSPCLFYFSLLSPQDRNRKCVMKGKIYQVIYLFDGRSGKTIHNKGVIKRHIHNFPVLLLPYKVNAILFFSFTATHNHIHNHTHMHRGSFEKERFVQPFCHYLCRPSFSKTWICDVILDSITYCISMPYQASLNIAFLF